MNNCLLLFKTLLLALIGFGSLQSAYAQGKSSFPTRPVEIVINFAPGGIADLSVRVMTEELSKNLGVPVVVTNRAGGGGAVGANYVKGARPDGYTVLAAATSGFTIVPLLNPGLEYELSDFIPLARYVNSPAIMVVRGDSPFTKFDDLISHARNNPGKLTCGMPGVGTASDFALAMLKSEARINFVNVPYKGGGELNAALLGGQVDFLIQSISVAEPLLKSGRLRALALNAYERSSKLPDVPTLSELGYPKSILLLRFGYFLPKGTPKEVVDVLASAFEKAIKHPSVKLKLESQGTTVDYENGPRFGASLVEEYRVLEQVGRNAKLIK